MPFSLNSEEIGCRLLSNPKQHSERRTFFHKEKSVSLNRNLRSKMADNNPLLYFFKLS
nr:MAG TPA: hypothetical protein [Caudoviricetes sp.]DAY91697.1 MAG TPA: hypothetical protein [Caudoviricetes sp.]